MAIIKRKQLMIRSPWQVLRANVRALLLSSYTLVALLCYLAIAIVVVMYLTKAPVYVSEMSIVLPGSGSNSSFALDNIGQVSSSTKAAYGSSAYNPRVNYREILKSRAVLKEAASRLATGEVVFKEPKILLIEQTSIINLKLEGHSPGVANKKAWALFDAFQLELEALRADESLRRDDSIERVLDQYRQKLHGTRQAIVRFQEKALLVSNSQLEQHMKQTAEVKSKRLYARSDLKQMEFFARQLGNDLGVSPALAGQAFALQTDAEFRGYLRELDSSASKLSEYTSRWGREHPKVVSERERFEFAKAALNSRGQDIVGAQLGDALNSMDLESSPGRSELFVSLINTYAKIQGAGAQISELVLTEARLNDQLTVLSRESVELERLEREHQLAEAVFTSAAAKLQANKADVFVSYPVVQMLAAPSMPLKAASPVTLLAGIVALIAAFIVSIGLVIVCQRKYLIAQLLKKS